MVGQFCYHSIIFMKLWVYLSVGVSVCLGVCLRVCLFVYLSVQHVCPRGHTLVLGGLGSLPVGWGGAGHTLSKKTAVCLVHF